MHRVVLFTAEDGEQAIYVDGRFRANDKPLNAKLVAVACRGKSVEIEHHDVMMPALTSWPSLENDAMAFCVRES